MAVSSLLVSDEVDFSDCPRYFDAGDIDGAIQRKSTTNRRRTGSLRRKIAKEGEMMVSGIESGLERVEEAVQDYEHRKRLTLNRVDRAEFAERIKLEVLFPGEHVAFVDEFESDNTGARLKERHVIAHDKNLAKVQDEVLKLPYKKRVAVCLHYVDRAQRTR